MLSYWHINSLTQVYKQKGFRLPPFKQRGAVLQWQENSCQGCWQNGRWVTCFKMELVRIWTIQFNNLRIAKQYLHAQIIGSSVGGLWTQVTSGHIETSAWMFHVLVGAKVTVSPCYICAEAAMYLEDIFLCSVWECKRTVVRPCLNNSPAGRYMSRSLAARVYVCSWVKNMKENTY